MSRVADVEERRHQILRAAVDVFAKRGYAAATISDIASAAGLAHGTVYLYFKSKADIFQSLVSAFVTQLVSDVAGSGASEDGGRAIADDLYRMFYRSLEMCARNPQAAAVCMRDTLIEGHELKAGLQELSQVLQEQVSVRLQKAIDAGELRPVSADSAAFYVVHLLGVAIHRLFSAGAAADPAQLAREIVDFVLLGLVADQAPGDFQRRSAG